MKSMKIEANQKIAESHILFRGSRPKGAANTKRKIIRIKEQNEVRDFNEDADNVEQDNRMPSVNHAREKQMCSVI